MCVYSFITQYSSVMPQTTNRRLLTHANKLLHTRRKELALSNEYFFRAISHVNFFSLFSLSAPVTRTEVGCNVSRRAVT